MTYKYIPEAYKELLNNYPQFTDQDIKYFVAESQKKVESLGLPRADCNISNTFNNATYRDYIRAEYCLKNCAFKCLFGLEYKKLS